MIVGHKKWLDKFLVRILLFDDARDAVLYWICTLS